MMLRSDHHCGKSEEFSANVRLPSKNNTRMVSAGGLREWVKKKYQPSDSQQTWVLMVFRHVSYRKTRLAAIDPEPHPCPEAE